MSKLILPASKARQGNYVLYATTIKVRDILPHNFYSIDRLDPENQDDKYQRLLNGGRAKKLASYIMEAQEDEDAFLPTSVFLATDKDIPFNKENNTIEIDTKTICPLSVVDGQHRLEGLKHAAASAEKKSSEAREGVLNLGIPVIIAVNLSEVEQMVQFYIVNTTQKSVDKSIEQRIISYLSVNIETEDVPTLPKWMSKRVESGITEKALKYVEHLNEEETSPWFGKIKMANASATKRTTIKQETFVKAIVGFVLTHNNPLERVFQKDTDKEKRAFLNYWQALANILDGGEKSVLYRQNGVELFCRFSSLLFQKARKDFTVQNMQNLLEECFGNIDDQHAIVGSREFWRWKGGAGRLNSGALYPYYRKMANALEDSDDGEEAKL